MQSSTTIHTAPRTLDGRGAGDCDEPYVFGRRLSSDAPGPFTSRQHVRLLVLRSRVEPGLFGADDLQTPLANTSSTTGALT
jgi:hypothetical protein